jgi:hypothetical protein
VRAFSLTRIQQPQKHGSTFVFHFVVPLTPAAALAALNCLGLDSGIGRPSVIGCAKPG